MIEDSVLQEVRATRDAFARSHGYDAHAMVAYLRELDERGDWPVVRLAPRPPVTELRIEQPGPFASPPTQPTTIGS